MNIRFLLSRIAALLLPIAACASCAVKPEKPEETGFIPRAENLAAAVQVSKNNPAPNDAGINLEQIAEIERSGSWIPGLAFAESGLREKSGDYAGAGIAAFKELSFAYSRGAADKEQVIEGLENALAVLDESSDPMKNGGMSALEGCLAFFREDWARAEEILSAIPEDDEPDSFLHWMLLVCAMESQKPAENISTFRSAYGAIRARYTSFPEYWYRGAKAFSSRGEAGDDGTISAVFAEHCIDSSPRGPFADNCRKIIAGKFGIAPNADEKYFERDNRLAIRSRAEIENVIRNSVSLEKPEMLEELFPLIALPDNPYTHYALGALKALAALPVYKTFFLEGIAKSRGRLGERLNYIVRG